MLIIQQKSMKTLFRLAFEAMHHKGFYLTCPMKIKIFIFRNIKKVSLGRTGQTAVLEILQ